MKKEFEMVGTPGKGNSYGGWYKDSIPFPPGKTVAQVVEEITIKMEKAGYKVTQRKDGDNIVLVGDMPENK